MNLEDKIKNTREMLTFLEFYQSNIANEHTHVQVQLGSNDITLQKITKYNDRNEPCGFKKLCAFRLNEFENWIDCVRAVKITAEAFEKLFLESYQ